MPLKTIAKSLSALAWLALAFAVNNAAASIDQYAALAEIQSPELSPDGRFLAALCADGGKNAVCIYDMSGKQQSVSFGVGKAEKIGSLRWGSPDHVLVYIKQRKSVVVDMENKEVDYRRIYAFSVSNKRGTVLMRDLGGSIDNLTNIVAILPDQSRVLIEVVLPADEDGLDYRALVYSVDLDSGRSKKIRTGERHSISHVYSSEGKLLATVTHNQRANVYRIKSDLAKDLVVFEEEGGISPLSIRGLVDDQKGLAVFFRDQRGAMKLSLADGKLKPLTINGESVGELGVPMMDDYASQLVGFDAWDGLLDKQIYIDSYFASVARALSKVFADKRVLIESWSRDRRALLLRVLATGRPAEYYLFNRDSGMVDFVATSARLVEGTLLGEVVPVQYKAADGLAINGFVTLPQGKTIKEAPFNMLMMPHGGPESHDDAGYDWMAQYYASLGYAVFQPNFRGSSGYGSNFRNAGFGEFGGKMVTDVLDGYSHLVAMGLARPDGTCAIGWSYGGYSVLSLAAIAPKQIRCVVAINALTDPYHLLAQHQRGDQSWDYLAEYLGNSEDKVKRRAYTPAERTGDINAPILMIHGEHDDLVPFIQAERFQSAMEQSPAKSVFRLVPVAAEDHYFQNVRARTAVLRESGEWLKKYFPIH